MIMVSKFNFPVCPFIPFTPSIVSCQLSRYPPWQDKSKLKKRGTERVGDGALHGKLASSRVKLSKPLPDSQLPLIGLLGAI